MKRLFLNLAAIFCLFGASGHAATVKAEKVTEKYVKQYPFFDTADYLHTCETEFTWPEGFQRLDPKKLTPFQNWVSNLPLWDDGKAVYSATTGTILRREQISRPMRLPWRTGHFRDCAIPLQLMADYKFWTDKPHELAIVTKKQDTVTYRKFLQSEISYTPHLRINFMPAEKRKPSAEEFSKFFDLCAFNTTYAGLEFNCEPIGDSELRPGDVYMGRDSVGLRGKVYVIMVVATDGKGDYRYVVGTGCAEPCDLYIPLFHGDRSNPWLTLEEVKALITGYPIIGFYRLKMPGKK